MTTAHTFVVETIAAELNLSVRQVAATLGIVLNVACGSARRGV